MKTYANRLKDKRAESSKFTTDNFGLKLGNDYPQIATELLKDDAFISDALMSTLFTIISADRLKAAIEKNGIDDVSEKPERFKLENVIRDSPFSYENLLKYLYWGIQIGRDLGHEQAQTLAKLEASLKEPVPAFTESEGNA